MRLLMPILFAFMGFTITTAAQSGVVRFAVEDAAGKVEEDMTVDFIQLPGKPLTYAVRGLPFPGEVLWRPETAEMAYQHPADYSWLNMGPSSLPKPAVAAEAAPSAPFTPWQSYPTRRWTVSVGATECKGVVTSPNLGLKTALTVAGMQDLFSRLFWLNAGKLPEGCDDARLSPETGAAMGTPTRWQLPFGTLVLQHVGIEATLNPADLPAWPKLAYPVAADARLRLLLAQLAVADRADFLKAHASLPMDAQIQALAKQLQAEGFAHEP